MKIVNRFFGCCKSHFPLAVVLATMAMLVLTIPAQAAPSLSVNPALGAVGTKVMITGTLFDSYKGDTIYILFDDKGITGSPLIVPDTGTFTTEITIPNDAIPGEHRIEVRTGAGSLSTLAENYFYVEQNDIDLDITEGPVGTEVTLTGSGFYSERMVTIYYYNIFGEKIAAETASPVGKFSHRFVIPPSSGGVHRIIASNAEGNLAETRFEVLPTIELSLDKASQGDLIHVTGNGFGYRTNVTLTLGPTKVAAARTDDYGNFEIDFNVPDINPNPYDVKAEDEEGNLDREKFILTAGASLSLASGSVGVSVTVRGSGFIGEESVIVTYDSLPVATATTNQNGEFTATFDIPPGNAGEHIITVTDGFTTRLLAFTVESEPPPVPEPVSPPPFSEVPSRVLFDWQDVTDASLPVVYKLQVSSDQSFSSLLLDKEGLTDSEYTLTEEETLHARLARSSYFWRIMAIDGAGNGSDWSGPWTLYINVPPAPELILPASDSESKVPVSFSWQPVSSPSAPVSYTLQVASDLNFTKIAIEKSGLTSTDYTQSADDEVEFKRDLTYYWRVKAFDGADNEGEWSNPSSFYINPSFSFPMWSIYTLIGIGVLIIGFLAFRIGRRTAYAPPE